MADKYQPKKAAGGRPLLCDWWKDVSEENDTTIFSALSKHIAGEADKHAAEDIDYGEGKTAKDILDSKVDKVTGKTLSSNDFTDEKKEILDKMSVENHTDPETGKVYPELHLGLEGQYDSVSVKGLYGDSIDVSGAIESKTDVRAVIFDEPNSSPTIHKLSEKANTSAVLTKTNTAAFTPTGNYHPATKKYVDDTVSAAGGGDMMKTVYDQNGNGIVDNAERLPCPVFTTTR